MLTILFYGAIFVAGFITGLLIGRTNVKKVEVLNKLLKDQLDKIK